MSNINDLKKYVAKRTGSETVIKSGRDAPAFSYLSSGIFLLNLALLGGFPEGRISTVIGQKASGKTTTCLKAVANFQRKWNGIGRPKLYAAWIDIEQAFDSIWAEKNGVNLEELILIQPFDGESAADIYNDCLDNDDIGLVVLDSIANLVGGKEIAKSSEDMVIAPVATIAQRMLRKASTIIAQNISKNQIKTGILINQWREKAGVSFGDPRTLPGGKYVRYYSSLELEIYNKKQVMEKDEHDLETIAYNDHAFKIVKNRAGNSIQEGEFVMNRRMIDGVPEAGIDDFDVVTRYAQKFKLVEGAGPKWQLTHPYTGEVIETKGRAPIVDLVKNDPQLYVDLQRKMISLQRKKIGLSENDWW